MLINCFYLAIKNPKKWNNKHSYKNNSMITKKEEKQSIKTSNKADIYNSVFLSHFTILRKVLLYNLVLKD
ncbi:MAG TPA: hypothetical protein DHV55_16465 [Clostridiaceae bacterium]|nr:hypothetical protein [Clostridiaceae bacterium]